MSLFEFIYRLATLALLFAIATAVILRPQGVTDLAFLNTFGGWAIVLAAVSLFVWFLVSQKP